MDVQEPDFGVNCGSLLITTGRVQYCSPQRIRLLVLLGMHGRLFLGYACRRISCDMIKVLGRLSSLMGWALLLGCTWIIYTVVVSKCFFSLFRGGVELCVQAFGYATIMEMTYFNVMLLFFSGIAWVMFNFCNCDYGFLLSIKYAWNFMVGTLCVDLSSRHDIKGYVAIYLFWGNKYKIACFQTVKIKHRAPFVHWGSLLKG